MSKSRIKEISEEQFKVLSDLGMPTYWDYEPLEDTFHIRAMLMSNDTTIIKINRYDRFAEVKEIRTHDYHFYTLVEDTDDSV